MKLNLALGCLLGIVLLGGCSSGGDKPPVVSGGPAPAPSNLTPEQKQAYDEALKKTQPPTGK